MALAALASGVVGVVGFCVRAVPALAVWLVAFGLFQVLVFEDGFGFGDLLAVAGEDDAADFVDVRLDLVAALAEVGGSDLDAVEEEPGVAAVEKAGGEGGEDAGDCNLNGGAVFERRELERGGGGCGLALGEVIEAEVLVVDGGGAAAASAGADVAADFVHA